MGSVRDSRVVSGSIHTDSSSPQVGNQIAVEDTQRILDLHDGKLEVREQQLVAGDVVFQRQTLALLGPYILEQLFGLLDILLINLDQIELLEEVEVVTRQQETHLVAVFGPVEPGILLLQLCYGDTVRNGSTRIDDLRNLQCKVVSQVRHRSPFHLREITLHQGSITQVTKRK